MDNSTVSYKPVVIIHGILAKNRTMLHLANKIKLHHPETSVHVISRFCGWSSLEPMERQVKEMALDIQTFSNLYPNGFHLIGYSQGGLIARGILEYFPNHTVTNFISLSSPQAGQYGTSFLRIFFPRMVREEAYELLYSEAGQFISFGNYWNDPHHQDLYFKYNNFLPNLNNEIAGNISKDFKRGLEKLQNVILIGGPNDGLIAPWQSSHFGKYDEKESIIDLRNQSLYTDNLIGLRSLDWKGALHMFTVPDISHHFWYRNNSVIKKYILPWLT